MSHSTIYRCTRCLCRHVRQTALACVCGGLILAQVAVPPAYSYWEAQDGKDRGEFQVYAGTTATGTSVGAVTTQITDAMLEREIEVPGPGYHAMQAKVPAEQRPVAQERVNYKGARIVTDVSSGSWFWPSGPRAKSE